MFEHNQAEYKQRVPRRATHIEAKVIIDGNSLDCKILNISATGAKLQIGKHIGRDAMVISLQIGEFGRFDAIIIWQNSSEFGVKFNHGTSEMADVLMGLASYG